MTVGHPTDEYPIAFCEHLYMILEDTVRSQSGKHDVYPRVSPYHVSFMDDVLEDLDTDELTLLSSVYTDSVIQGYTNHVRAANEVSLLSLDVVTNDTAKWFMNWLNSRAKGTVLDLSLIHI